MKILAYVLLLGFALSAFGNGTWHGAYLGKGKVTNSCYDTSEEYVSTISWGGFDGGTYFYYGLRFADSVRIIADDVVLSRDWKAVFGNHDLISGEHTSYEDCPGRDVCEGECCEVEGDSDDSAATKNTPDTSLGIVSHGSGRAYPIKNEVRLKFKNGEKAHLSWIKTEEGVISLEGKIVLTQVVDGMQCELRWKDKLVWYDDKPEEVQDTLVCIGGSCRWQDPQAGQNE